MPKVSAIMSAYNAEKYIKETMDSVLSQTFKDFEFIIINDGSNDSTKKIILSYRDPRIKFIENEKNIGLAKSLNRGLKIAEGEYIARVDADDIPALERFKQQANFLDTHKDIAVVGSWAQIIDEESGKTYVLKISCDPIVIKWSHIFKNQITHSSAFFRKKIIEEMGCYNEKYRYAQDFDLWFKVSRKYKLANIPWVLTKHRIHGKSVSGTAKTHNTQKQFILEILFNNINYYLRLNQNDFKVFIDAIKSGKILNIKNFLKVRKLYKELFNAFIKKESLNKEEIKKILPDYERKRKSMFLWYVKYKFSKI